MEIIGRLGKLGYDPKVLPQVIARDPHSEEAILYFMVTGQFPFGEESPEIVQNIMENEPTFEGDLSPPLVDLLRKCLQKQRENRITIPRITEHPWFSAALYQAMRTLNSADTLDMEIISHLGKLGYDPKVLPQVIARDPHSEEAILYQFLKRDSATNAADGMIRAFENAPATFSHRLTEDPSATASRRPHAARARAPRPPLIGPPARHGPLGAQQAMHPVHSVASVPLSLAQSDGREMTSHRPGAARPRLLRPSASGELFKS
jgi:serine/threonine protein kinase